MLTKTSPMLTKPKRNGSAEHRMGAEIECAKKHFSVQKTLSSTFGTIIPIPRFHRLADWLIGCGVCSFSLQTWTGLKRFLLVKAWLLSHNRHFVPWFPVNWKIQEDKFDFVLIDWILSINHFRVLRRKTSTRPGGGITPTVICEASLACCTRTCEW